MSIHDAQVLISPYLLPARGFVCDDDAMQVLVSAVAQAVSRGQSRRHLGIGMGESEVRDDDQGDISEEAARFMAANGRTFMVTLRKDGSPTAHPMAGFFGGRLYLNTYGKSAKAKNLGRDDRICCVLTNPSDAETFEGALYRGHARRLTVDEVFADRVPDGLAWARNPRSQGSQDQPDIPPEDARKIGDTAGRITRGLRVIYEISPDQVGMLGDVREV